MNSQPSGHLGQLVAHRAAEYGFGTMCTLQPNRDLPQAPNESSCRTEVPRGRGGKRLEHRSYRPALRTVVDERVVSVHVAQAALKSESTALEKDESVFRAPTRGQGHGDRKSQLERHVEPRYGACPAPGRLDAAEVVDGKGVSTNGRDESIQTRRRTTTKLEDGRWMLPEVDERTQETEEYRLVVRIEWHVEKDSCRVPGHLT
jgi:hypothetical protein